MTQPAPHYEVAGSITFMVPAANPEAAATAIDNFITYYVTNKVAADNLLEGMTAGTVIARSSFHATSATPFISDGSGGWTPTTETP